MCGSSKYPCGHCPSCISRKRNEWSIRAQQHSDASAAVFFGLLTYAPEHAHEVVDEETGEINYSLDYEDVQKCFKRFRKNHGVYKVSYLVSGEYGDEKERAHWHILLFLDSVSFDNDYQIRAYERRSLGWRAALKYHRLLHRDAHDIALYKIDDKFAIHNRLLQSWRLGFTPLSYPRYNNRCVHYATKYIYNKVQKVPNGCQKPVFRVSHGIGKQWLDNEDNIHNVMSSFERGIYFVDEPNSHFLLRLYDLPNDALNGRPSYVYYNGVRKCTMYKRINVYGGNYPLPRYYVKKLYEKLDPVLLAEVKKCNEDFFDFEYYRRIKRWMNVKHYDDSVCFSDVRDEWISYCRDVEEQKLINIKNKFLCRKKRKLNGGLA